MAPPSGVRLFYCHQTHPDAPKLYSRNNMEERDMRCFESKRLFPPKAVPLCFDAQRQQQAFDLFGANCGPGAIAGVCGFDPIQVVQMLGPKFAKLNGTTEVMLRDCLDRLGIAWEDVPAGLTDYGIARIQWEGPWLYDADPFEKYRHSHWIGVSTRGLPHPMIFDINAISVGGWISLSEWDEVLRPWLLNATEPRATGNWWISETLKIRLFPRNPTA